MIDERPLRRPAFSEDDSVLVRFGDRSLFFVPKPWVEMRTSFSGGRPGRFVPFRTHGPATDRQIEAIASTADPAEKIALVGEMAAGLLLTQYDLTDAMLEQILSVRLGDPSSFEWLGEVVAIATGRSGPKPSRAGVA